MALVAGSRVGPYEILSPIGAGAMGEVYRARDSRFGREVALKVLPADHASDSERPRRIEQEARAVAALRHPHILAVHDVGQAEGLSYVVFELLEGQTLRQKLEHGALASRKAAEYRIQIGKGLAAAHARGIVHRDLKPENVLVTREGDPADLNRADHVSVDGRFAMLWKLGVPFLQHLSLVEGVR